MSHSHFSCARCSGHDPLLRVWNAWLAPSGGSLADDKSTSTRLRPAHTTPYRRHPTRCPCSRSQRVLRATGTGCNGHERKRCQRRCRQRHRSQHHFRGGTRGRRRNGWCPGGKLGGRPNGKLRNVRGGRRRHHPNSGNSGASRGRGPNGRDTNCGRGWQRRCDGHARGPKRKRRCRHAGGFPSSR